MAHDGAPSRPTIDALLDAASRLVAEGRENATVREIAAEAQVGLGTLYAHFASKDEVFLAALDRHLRREEARERDALAGAMTVYDAAFALVKHRIACATDDPAFFVLAAERALGRTGEKPVKESFDRRVDRLAACWPPGDVLPSLSPREAAIFMTSGLDGAVLAALEIRPQYLDDPAFAVELTAFLARTVARVARPMPLTRARSNEARLRRKRARAVEGVHKQPRQARSRVLVDAIIGGAERIIERAGLDRASTPNIAEAAGVSVGSLYQYFRSRESVLAGFVDAWIEHDLRKLRVLLRAIDVPLEQAMLETAERMHASQLSAMPLYRALFALLPRLGRYDAVQDFLELSSRETAEHVAEQQGGATLDAHLSVFVVGRAWVGWDRWMIVREPELFAKPAFREVLKRASEAFAPRSE